MRKIAKVLIVDDDIQIIEALNLVLKGANYETVLRTSGQNLPDFVKLEKPDAILLDIRLLDGNGLSITKDLKQNPKTRDIPVILISARVGNLSQEELNGANTYLAKPFRMNTLLDLLKNYLPSSPTD